MTNEEHFRAAYTETLTAVVVRNPKQYRYGVDKVPATVDKMIKALIDGKASLGPAAKMAAQRCGIKPTQKAIREYLALSPIVAGPLSDDSDGNHYKLEVLTDATGSRWWVNCWNATTPFHAMGASETRPIPATTETIELARCEALVSLKGSK